MAEQLVRRLDVFGEATFDANGRAEVTVGPPPWTKTWRVTNAAVSVIGASSAVTTVDQIRYANPINQQLVNNSNVLVNDNELSFTVEGGKSYEVEVFGFFSTNVACDLQTAWSIPAGSTCLKWILGATDTAASFTSRNDTRMRTNVSQAATAIPYQLDAGGVGQGCMERGILVAAISGNWTFQWAQFAATIGNLTRFASSYAKITEIN